MEPLISIVDDDEPVREAVRRILTSHGLTATVFGSARQLLDSDQLDQMSCLIVDGKMPGISGFALHRQLLAAGRRIPTILMTGRPTAGGRKRALAAGVAAPARSSQTAKIRLLEVAGKRTFRYWRAISSGWRRSLSPSCGRWRPSFAIRC
jgi:CheY-like chemotaxis protein